MLPIGRALIKDCEKKNQHIINTVSVICKSISKDDIARRGIKNCDDIAAKYGLDISEPNPFAFCPVKVYDEAINIMDDEIARQSACISIYAVCIAYLILSKKREQGREDPKEKEEHKRLLNRLLNTIVVTHTQAEAEEEHLYFWPNKVSVDEHFRTGTCNQTCIVLSTLLRAGFLIESPSVDKKVLKSRYELIIGALNWLVKNQSKEGAWLYGESCTAVGNNRQLKHAVLPSHYCYENIEKYISFFNSPDGSNKMAGAVKADIIDDMHAACDHFETWVEGNIDSKRRKFKGIRKNDGTDRKSMLHTCLCNIIYFYNFDVRRRDLGKFKTITGFVLDRIDDLDLDHVDNVEKYNYQYKTSNGKVSTEEDVYEITPEYLLITYSTRLLKSNYAWYLSQSQKNKLKELNYIAYESLLKKCEEIKTQGKQCLLIEGTLKDRRHYPIYGLYNMQVCLLELLNSAKNEQDVPIISWPGRNGFIRALKYVFVALLALGLIGVIVYAITYINHINKQDTIICIIGGLITGLLTGLLTGLICHCLFNKQENKE